MFLLSSHLFSFYPAGLSETGHAVSEIRTTRAQLYILG